MSSPRQRAARAALARLERLRVLALVVAAAALCGLGAGCTANPADSLAPAEAAAATGDAGASPHGLRARYYDNPDFTALKLTRTDPRIGFNWGTGRPASAVRPDSFSVRWDGQLEARRSGTYTLYVRSSDGARLWVDGARVLSRWRTQGTTEWSTKLSLAAGRHKLRLDYFEGAGSANARLAWAGPGLAKQVVPTERLFAPGTPYPQCSDGRDNDGDGKADRGDDPGCVSVFDASEVDPAPQCSDGRDNDGDGKVDHHGGDPGCTSTADDSESPDPTPPPPTPEGMQRWSDPATWGAEGLPEAGETVSIPAGKTVLLDRSTPPLAGLQIDGALVFEDDYLTLTSDWIMVHGKLQVGSEANPFTKRARIELTGADESQNVMGMGTKMIGVMGGELDLHGERRDSWTRLGATAAKGSRTITLERNPGWRAGDRIAIASTDYEYEQDEEAAIASVSDNTLTLSQPLEYEHFGQRQTIDGRTVDERAEVTLLSRNVRVEGEENSSISGFGGQIMAMNGAKVRVEGTELARMGQRNILRRYPIHFHMLGDGGAGSYVRDSSIHHTFNRCVTIHGTNRLALQGNTCFDHIGHGFFFEDGAETDNLLEGNLGFGTHEPRDGEELLPSDDDPATFWVTNPDNVLRGNVAAGSDGTGFWYALPEHPTGLSGQAPGAASTWPRRTPLGEFSANVAHSNDRDGLNVDDGPRPDGHTETTSYRPVVDPADQKSAPVVARFTGLTAYRNRSRAVWLRGSDHRLEGATLADNRIGATFASRETFLTGSLLVGETANKGNPSSWDVEQGRVGLDGRSLPYPWDRDFPIRGYEFYDGRVGVSSTTFANFHANSLRQASALGFNLSNAFNLDPGNHSTGLRFPDASKRVYLPDPVAGKDGDASSIFTDRDGSLTGNAGAIVTANNRFLAEEGCLSQTGALRTDWNTYVCAPASYVGLTVGTDDGDPARIKPLRLTRSDGAVQTLNGSSSDSTRAYTNTLADRELGVAFNGGSPQRMRFVVREAPTKWQILAVPYAQKPKVTRWGCDLATGHDWCRGAATGLADLRAKDRSAFWHDAANGRLYLKVYAAEASNTYEELKVEPAPKGPRGLAVRGEGRALPHAPQSGS